MTVKTAADSTYERLKQEILNGEFLPSQRLVEAKLAEHLGASRHNVRVALDRLSTDGLVVIEPNRGATVSNLSLEAALDILEAREALEAQAARLAAPRISDEALRDLKAHLDTMRAALSEGRFDEYSATNKLFHSCVHRAALNRTIPEVINTLRLRMTRLQVRTVLVPGRGEKSYAEHQAIYEALASHDPDRAEMAARKHMSSLRETIAGAWSLVKT